MRKQFAQLPVQILALKKTNAQIIFHLKSGLLKQNLMI